MKKFLPIVVVFLLVIGGYAYFQPRLAAQGSETGNTEEDDHPKEVTETGTISSLGGISVPGSGTHLLTKIDKSTILLTGLGTNLDDYLQKVVEVSGLPSQTVSGKQLVQVLHVSIARDGQVPVDIQDKDAMKWEAYANPIFGISLQKKHFWKVVETNMSVDFTITPAAAPCKDTVKDVSCAEMKDNLIHIERIANDANAKLQTFTGNEKMATKNLIGPHKLVGYKYTEYVKGMITFVVARENNVYLIRYTPGTVRSFDPSGNDFFTLISTFDFVPFATPPAPAAKK